MGFISANAKFFYVERRSDFMNQAIPVAEAAQTIRYAEHRRGSRRGLTYDAARCRIVGG
jgi:LPS sulfotransferase NodH